MGVKFPKLGHATIPGATGSSESFTSRGHVFLAPHFRGNDLTLVDFNGACAFAEVSGGLAWGGAGYAMAFGMNAAALAAGAFNSIAAQHAFDTATGYVVFYGVNYGIQAGLGGTGYMGVMRAAVE